jgi:adenylyl-sulfate kinase
MKKAKTGRRKTVPMRIRTPGSKITLRERERRNGHRGCVVWLTGLSAAGKSTIATELERVLFRDGCQARVLDGDHVRRGLCRDLGFSPKDREENIRRVGEVARLFADAGYICITAFISPYRADRALARKLMADGRFIEVFVNAPLAVCEARDPKGLYARARKHQLRNFTGVSAPYETPRHPEVELRTDRLTIAEAVDKVLRHLQKTCGVKTRAWTNRRLRALIRQCTSPSSQSSPACLARLFWPAVPR